MAGAAGRGSEGSGCGKIMGYGCLGAVALVAVVGVAIWASWGTLRQSKLVHTVTDSVTAAKAELVRLEALQKELQTAYPAEHVDVQANVSSTNGRTVKTLSVSFLNPRFEIPDGADSERAAARRIAAAIASRYAGLDRYDQLQIDLRHQGESGSGYSSDTRFEFPTAELVSPGATSH